MGLAINEKLGIIKLTKVPLLLCDKVGVNKRIYPCEVVKKAIEDYKQLIQVDPTYKYMFYKHPYDGSKDENIDNIVGALENIYVDENEKVVYGDINLFPTKQGELIYFLLKNNYTIGISARGRVKTEKDYVKVGDKNLEVNRVIEYQLEGFDFVIFPSYIITQVKKDNISGKEQITLEQSQNIKLPSILACSKYDENGNCIEVLLYDEKGDYITFEQTLNLMEQINTNEKDTKQIELDTIKDKFTSKQTTFDKEVNKNQVENKEVSEMQDLQKEKLELEVKKLELEKAKLEKEVEEYKKSFEQLQKEIETLKQEKLKTESELEVKKSLLIELAKTEEQIKQYEQRLKELEEKIKEKEEQVKAFEQTLNQQQEAISTEQKKEVKEGEYVVVKCCGKTFDNENPPKIRVVPIDEKVSTKRWGLIDHDITRKLVWLTGDRKIAEETFGVIRNNMKHWSDLKYPVYEHQKSTEDNYDVDLVLNVNGLRTALIFALGRPGQFLKKHEKARLFRFLYEKYKALKEAGIIDEIPKVLENIVKRLKTFEQIEFKVNGDVDHYFVPVLEILYLTGVIEVEPQTEDKSFESVEKIEIDFDEDNLITALSEAFTFGLDKKDEQKALEQSQTELDTQNNDILAKLNLDNFEEFLKTLFDIINETEDAKEYGIETFDDFIEKLKELKREINRNGVDGLPKLIEFANLFEPYDVVRYIILALVKLPCGECDGDIDDYQENENVAGQETTEENNETETELQQENEDINNTQDTFEQYVKELFKEKFGEDVKDVKEAIETLIKDYIALSLELEDIRLKELKHKALEQVESVDIPEGVKEELIEEIMRATDEEELNKILVKFKDLYIPDENNEDLNETDEDVDTENEETKAMEQGKGIPTTDIVSEYKKNEKHETTNEDLKHFLMDI